MNNVIYNNDKDFLNYYLENIFYKQINSCKYQHNIYKTLVQYKLGPIIEFIIRPECNQKCEYCYITKYGEQLYPLSERKNKNEIINNFQMLLNYYESKNLILPAIELFAGDLFFDDIIYELFQIIYKYYKKIYNTEIFCMNVIQNSNLPPFEIIIPSNFSFVINKKHLPLLKEWKQKFSKINVKINFSVSADGKYATQVREKKSADEVDLYYEEIFNAAFELQAGFHPMISVESIDTSIKNYDWWLTKIAEYKEKFNAIQCDFSPMFLEVRDDYWTKDAILQYQELLKHIIQKRLELCDNSIELLTRNIFLNNYLEMTNSDIIKIPVKRSDKEHIPCLLTKALHINVSNMSIVPCHRLTYYHFIGGKFEVKDNKIVDIIPINPSGYIGIHTCNFNYQPGCNSCKLSKVCMKGCFGAQYESSGEIFIPNKSVCDLLHAKYKTLLIEYNNLGVLKELKEKQYFSEDLFQILIELCAYFDIQINL